MISTEKIIEQEILSYNFKKKSKEKQLFFLIGLSGIFLFIIIYLFHKKMQKSDIKKIIFGYLINTSWKFIKGIVCLMIWIIIIIKIIFFTPKMHHMQKVLIFRFYKNIFFLFFIIFILLNNLINITILTLLREFNKNFQNFLLRLQIS